MKGKITRIVWITGNPFKSRLAVFMLGPPNIPTQVMLPTVTHILPWHWTVVVLSTSGDRLPRACLLESNQLPLGQKRQGYDRFGSKDERHINMSHTLTLSLSLTHTHKCAVNGEMSRLTSNWSSVNTWCLSDGRFCWPMSWSVCYVVRLSPIRRANYARRTTYSVKNIVLKEWWNPSVRCLAWLKFTLFHWDTIWTMYVSQ